jgi:ABC-2 type transport system permease protein
MFSNIFLFEIRYRLLRPATYIYFAVFLIGAGLLGATDAVQVGGGSPNIHRNSPVTIANMMGLFTAFFMVITSALMSTPVYRDFEHDTHHLFFTLPISKLGYLGGRFAGSLVIALLVYTAVPLGLLAGSFIGSLAGSLEPDKIGPFRIDAYIQPFFTIILPNVLFCGAIFFSLASLSRKMVYAYLGNVVLLVVYITCQTYLYDLDNKNIAAVFDPLALTGLSEITRYWTTSESNTLLVPFNGILMLNRFIWVAVAAAVFLFTYRTFRFESFMERKKSSGKALSAEPQPVLSGLRAVEQRFSFLNHLRQLLNLAFLNFRSIVKEIPFIAITLCGVILLVFTSSLLAEIYGTSVHPVTYALLEKTSGVFSLFVIVLIVFYSGELVWQERRLKMHLIYDALPVPNWLLLGSKMLSMFMLVAFLMLVVMVCSIGIQLSQGFTDIDFGLYFYELFYLRFFGFALIAVLAVLVQTLVTDKFMGHFVMIIYYVLNIVMGQVGLSHNLYRYNGRPGYVFSEMNGYGHLLEGVHWMNLYWGLFAILLAVVSNLFWVRGAEKTFRWRMRLASERLNLYSRLALGLSIVGFAATGAFVYYNTNVLNKYRSKKDMEQLAVKYEKTYRKYYSIPQPKIVGAKLFVDIFPQDRSVRSRGTLLLRNNTAVVIDSVHINLPAELEIRKLSVGGSSRRVLEDNEMGYHIYRLSTPLMPGDSVPLDFDLYYQPKGFTNSMAGTGIVYNGTFVNNTFLCPGIGYSPEGELEDRAKRRKNGLKPRDRMAPPTDSLHRMSTYIGDDGDWIDFEATVSTSADQVAIAPGYLQNEWTEGNRRYFHYTMDSKILNFYSFLSAEYEIKRDKWKDVNLEIYYHKGHSYNLDKMMKAMKKSLEYYTASFSPYQHKQVRIIEFPRYAQFAQSFPNTIPYSESIGFIANLKNEEDIDYVYYVTAHEVAHQWWAHQVIGGNVQGSTLMSETMSQYSALMVMEKEYGKDQMHKFLKYELDRYLTGRRIEQEKEMPAMLCENQQYIHYSKGSLIMYALKDYIGEERLNKAMADYIAKTGFQQAPFTNSLEFVSFLKAATPDSLQYLVKDMFETITLYSNRTDEVSYTRLNDGKYKVKITVDSRKYRADSVGTEKEIAVNDYIDIGILGERKEGGTTRDKPLYLQKHKVKNGKNTFEIVVSEEPKKAGIDVYNKLIDRDSEDNVRKTVQAS